MTFGRMKIGSQTEYCDMANNPILIADNILADGKYYYINTYLKAIPYDDGMGIVLSELIRTSQSVEVVYELPTQYKPMGESKRKDAPKKVIATVTKEIPQSDTPAAIPPPSTPKPEKKAEKKDDQVNHPDHYNTYGVETIDMMVAIWGKQKVADWCEITAFKYRMRMGAKSDNPIEQDRAKELWYLDKASALRK